MLAIGEINRFYKKLIHLDIYLDNHAIAFLLLAMHMTRVIIETFDGIVTVTIAIIDLTRTLDHANTH